MMRSVKREVGDALQGCQRYETVGAAVLVELQQGVVAVDLEAQEAIVDHVLHVDLKIGEQVVEVDLVLADFEAGDDIATEVTEIVRIDQSIEEEVVAGAAIDLVGAKAALDHVIARIAVENVVATAAGNQIRTVAAMDGVGAV